MGTPGPDSSANARALAEGARRSREAQDPGGPLPVPAPPPGAVIRPGPPEPRHVVLWRRHKGKLLALLFILVTEFVLLTLGKTIALGPQ